MNALKAAAVRTFAQLHLSQKPRLWAGVRAAHASREDTACLRRLFPDSDVSQARVAAYLDEFANAACLRESIEAHRAVIGKSWEEKLSGRSFGAILFCFVGLRLLKPEVVVETGCATGWTSAVILYALHQNRTGHLHSIDLRAEAGERSMDWTLPANLEPGFLVPEVLRDRWTLTLGDAREQLLPRLQEQRALDVFYHDSDHTYQQMMWEYTSAWPYLKPGGLLISDDIGWNTAFWDFAISVGRPPVIHQRNCNFGALSQAAA